MTWQFRDAFIFAGRGVQNLSMEISTPTPPLGGGGGVVKVHKQKQNFQTIYLYSTGPSNVRQRYDSETRTYIKYVSITEKKKLVLNIGPVTS